MLGLQPEPRVCATPSQTASIQSYVAPIALIDLITAGVGSLRREQVVGRLREADFEQKHGYRWYQTES